MKIQGESAGGVQNQSNFNRLSADSYSQEIQKQITDLQNQIQNLSGNQDISQEEKMERRQELTAKMNELRQQLRQYQLEKQQQAGKSHQEESQTNPLPGGRKEEVIGLSDHAMTAMIAADSALDQSKAAGGLVSRMEGKAAVLKSEIQLDAGRGKSTEAKEAEKEELEKRIEKMHSGQISYLGEVNQNIQKANESQQATDTKSARSSDQNKETVGLKGSNLKREQDIPGESNRLSHYQGVDLKI